MDLAHLNHVRLLTVEQVAEVLACSKASVYRWIEAGKLPVVRRGRLVRIRLTDLEAWVADPEPVTSNIVPMRRRRRQA